VDIVERSKYDMLINKTVEIVIEKEVIKCNSIIVDAIHTKARYNQKSPKEILTDRSRKLRKSVYEIDESMKVKFPSNSHKHGYAMSISSCLKIFASNTLRYILSNNLIKL